MDRPERIGRRRAAAAGFTLVELMIASLIFSMVAAGLAAIYTAAFRQSAQTLFGQRLRSRAALSGKTFNRVVSGATRILSVSGDAVRVCQNIRPDAAQAIVGALPVRGYAFCVQPNAVGSCPARTPSPPAPPSRGPGCLYFYEWSGGPAACTGMPAVNAGNCGQTLGGAGAELLVDLVTSRNFTRSGGAIRAQLAVGRAATPTSVRQEYAIDTSASAQLDGRVP